MNSGCNQAVCLKNITLLVLFGVLVFCGCSGTKSRHAASLETARTGDTVTVEGVLSLRGSAPFPMLILETGEGRSVLIESSTLQTELNTLSGMFVLIQGVVLPSLAGETPVVNASDYDLLPLSSGEQPVLGMISLEGDQCVLTTRDNKRYWIRGDFSELFKEFRGARVWAAGSVGEYTQPEQPENTVPFKVLQYGVLTQQR